MIKGTGGRGKGDEGGNKLEIREVGEGEKERRKKEVGRGWNVGFWNIAGLKNKDEEFWSFLRELEGG